MDTSNNYKEMCFKAKEIQALYDYSKIDVRSYHSSFPKNNEDGMVPVWLPRQDQLQDMLNCNLIAKLKMLSNMFIQPILKIEGIDDITESEINELRKQFKEALNSNKPLILTNDLSSEMIWMDNINIVSLEQCWLMVVMKEKYNKVWINYNWKNIKQYPQLIDNPDFEKWCEINEDELRCIFAETGADREMDFDLETEEEKLFQQQF